MHLRPLALAAVLTLVVLSGCFGGNGGPSDGAGDDAAPTTGRTAHERVALPFDVAGDWSKTLQAGPYGIKAGEGHFVDVDLPITELGATVLAPEGPRAHLGLFLPEGAPAGTKFPVIVDAGPYYSTSTSMLPQNEGDTIATEPANRLGRFLIENFVPHGYAVAQVSVMGSGDSNHCFDMFGMAEQLGVDAAVTWLGEQEWSNGNVALIGRSYDGSTPWQAAAFGNPHLKTIVPISGLHGLRALVTQNGSSEGRVYSFHNVVYGQFGIDGDAGDIQHVCPDYLSATPLGVAAFATGDEVVPMDEGYWREREFLPRVLENYDGSVYFIHGLQDFNVDPHMIAPAYQQLEAQGLDIKGLFGQWGHMYPDRPGEHSNLGAFPHSVRYDWAEDLKEWFDYYLKDEGPTPVLAVEVQDNIGRWHVESTFPPGNADVRGIALGSGTAQVTSSAGTSYVLPPLNEADATPISGQLFLEAAVTPTGANGQLTYVVYDDTADVRLTFGTMDFRYREGEPAQPVVPNQRIVIRVDSQPFDFVLPAAHSLRIEITQSGSGYSAAPSATPYTIHAEGSTLFVPVLDSPASHYFTPPAWEGTANATAPQP